MQQNRVWIDPSDPFEGSQALAELLGLSPDEEAVIARIIVRFPRGASVVYDSAQESLYADLVLVDKFTFDLEADELVLLSSDNGVIVDALIEMCMYLSGFSTMLGVEDAWLVEFTIGAWKVVKKHIKRELDIPDAEKPRIIVGLPPAHPSPDAEDSYPFRTLVMSYDRRAFYQMVLLAARDDVAVYFPPETHHKVLAAYVYVRRSMQAVGQGLVLGDHTIFNERLLREAQRMEQLFRPQTLPLSTDTLENTTFAPNSDTEANQLGVFPSGAHTVSPENNTDLPADSPFVTFIDQLLNSSQDDDTD